MSSALGMPLSIRGLGAVSAAGVGASALWDAAMRARPLAQPVTRYAVDDLPTRRAALVPGAAWDALNPSQNPRERALALALACAREALAGGSPPPRTGLFLGTSLGAVHAWEPWHRAHVTGSKPPVPAASGHGDVAPALAFELGLRGPALTVSTACTSSSTALIQAADALALGEIDCALVVGVDVLCRFVHAGFACLGILSSDDRTPAPFATPSTGLWLGEGAAAVVLTPNGPGLARYLGGATASDGTHMTTPDRCANGMIRAIRGALGAIPPGDVSWVSAHATCTRPNDAMEAVALETIFGASAPTVHAAKPVFGHTLGACGILEVVLCVEVLRRGLRPPTASVDARLECDPRVSLDQRAQPLTRGVVLSLNAAMGGHNTAVVLGAP